MSSCFPCLYLPRMHVYVYALIHQHNNNKDDKHGLPLTSTSQLHIPGTQPVVYMRVDA